MSYTEAKGYGSPFIRFYYGEEELTPSVSFFCLKHKEKEGTTAEIIMETDNPDLPDLHPFQEHDKIEIVHGYLSGPKSKPITYYVREVYPTYSDKGISLRLRVADRASYMKEMASLVNNPLEENPESKRLATRADLLGVLERNYGMSVKVMGFIVNRADEILDENGKMKAEYKEWLFKRNTQEFQKAFGGSGSGLGTNELAIKGISSKTRDDIKNLESIIGYLQEPLTNNVASTKKDHQVLKDSLKGTPGNVQITSEGDELNIEPRNFNQAPFRTYKYKSESSFIEFSPETKNRNQGASATNINITIPNREEKRYEESDHTEYTDDTPRLGNGVKVPNPDQRYAPLKVNSSGVIQGTGRYKGGSTRGGPGGMNRSITPTEVGLNIFGFGVDQQVTTRFKDPQDPTKGVEDLVLLEGVRYDGNTSSYAKPDGIQTTARDETATQFRPVAILNAKQYLQAVIDATEGNTASNEAENKRNEASVKMNPATLKVIYDPELTNKKVIRVENASKKYSGNYYIIDCEHYFQKGQYAYSQLSLARSGRGITGNENLNTVDVEDIGKNAVQFRQEQRDQNRSVTIVKPETGKE